MKVTQWFDGKVKPVHAGIYERDHSTAFSERDRLLGIKFCLWNGDCWIVYGNDMAEAAREICSSMYQCLQWRGLTENPNLK